MIFGNNKSKLIKSFYKLGYIIDKEGFIVRLFPNNTNAIIEYGNDKLLSVTIEVGKIKNSVVLENIRQLIIFYNDQYQPIVDTNTNSVKFSVKYSWMVDISINELISYIDKYVLDLSGNIIPINEYKKVLDKSKANKYKDNFKASFVGGEIQYFPKSIEFEIDDDTCVTKTKLYLLENNIKFSERDGTINIGIYNNVEKSVFLAIPVIIKLCRDQAWDDRAEGVKGVALATAVNKLAD